jgi:hypothetical protein
MRARVYCLPTEESQAAEYAEHDDVDRGVVDEQ